MSHETTKTTGGVRWVAMSELGEKYRVDLVAGCYSAEVRKACGHLPQVRGTHPGTALWQSALEFWGLVGTFARSLPEVMGAAIALYSVDWCRKMFQRPYPPFSVAIGRTARQRLARVLVMRKKETVQQMDVRAADIAAMLKETLGLQSARQLVADGWPEDEVLRDFVRRKL